MRIAQEPIRLAGFYVAGLLCLVSAVLKLTIEEHWSWWRVLLPLWAVLGHNILYIAIGFAWLFFVAPGPPGEEDITIREALHSAMNSRRCCVSSCSPITCSHESRERTSGCGYGWERVNSSCSYCSLF
jgi:hypothetical protein